jgi:LacI family transcriptional regulator
VPFFTGYFFRELLRGIQEETSKHQYDLILYSVDQTNKKEIFLKKIFQERKIDGLLFVSLEMNDGDAENFHLCHFPVVLIDNHHPGLDSITVENRDGAYVATEHLIRLGHTRIAMINGHLKSAPARARLDGYRRALRDHHIDCRNEHICIGDFVHGDDGFNQVAGFEAMRQLLSLNGSRPTAIFVASDIQAVGAMKAIRESDLHIPEDMAMVGFDDIEMAQYIGLTTMRQPMFQMGRLAVERLVERISGGQSNSFHKTFHTELIIRESCGALKNDRRQLLTQLRKG